MRALAVVLLLLVACDKKSKSKPPSREVTGALELDGKPLDITRCAAGRGVTTYVELITASGKLRFEDKQLFWSASDPGRGEPLQCDKLDRSWGGGLRKDGTSYFRGHLIFVCRGPSGQSITGDLQLDCGAITADERQQLDKNQQDARCNQVQQRAAELRAKEGSNGSASKLDSSVLASCLEDKWSAEIQQCMLAAGDVSAWEKCLPPDLSKRLTDRMVTP